MAHVLFISHWYPNDNHPTEGIFVREHALAVARYHQVTVIAVRGIHHLSKPRLRIVHQDDAGLSTYSLSYKKALIPKTTWLHRWQGVREIIRKLAVRNELPDIIHANVYSSADLAYALHLELGIPAVLSEHASSYPRRLLNTWQVLKLRFLLPRLDCILPVSTDLIQHIQALGIRARFQPVPNTVDTSIFTPEGALSAPPNPVKQILLVASLSKIKNIGLALDAMTEIKKKHPIHLSIIGEGPERNLLETRTKQNNLRQDVTFYGNLRKEDVAGAMRRADVLILSSLWENQPVVLLEAMASGLPVVAPSVGGIPEVVKDFCGRLYPPGSVEGLASEVSFLLDHKEIFRQEVISAYAQERFGYDTVGQEFTRIYNQVLEAYP